MAGILGIAFTADEFGSLAVYAQATGQPMEVLLLSGSPSSSGLASAVHVTGWAEVPPADHYAKGLAQAVARFQHIVIVSSMRGKDLASRLAGYLDAAMVTDVIRIVGENQFQRPVVAGAALATVEVRAPQAVLTFRPSAFPAASVAELPVASPISIATEAKSEVLQRSAKKGGRPDLTQAKRIISGGRPLKDAATFEAVLGSVADAMGGAVGATRAAVDAGIAPNELQVGQTGKIVAPDLYIAAGVSGSTQHVAGMKDSKTIVAINKDSDAAIFEIADFGLVADLYEALPELVRKLST
jgi:electron transfer flavoprotein alpha subunit